MQRTAEQVRNLRDFINQLWAIPASKFAMHDYDCGTAACMEGWYRRLHGDEVPAREAFGLDDWASICHMGKHPELSVLERFDELLKPEERKLAMLHILTQMLNTGQGCWIVALVETVGPELAKAILEGVSEVPELSAGFPTGEITAAPMQRALPDRAEPHKEAALLLEEAW